MCMSPPTSGSNLQSSVPTLETNIPCPSSIVSLPRCWMSASADGFGQRQDDAGRPADVADQVGILVPGDLADELGTVLAKPRDGVLEVVDLEHDLADAEGVRRGIRRLRIIQGRAEESRELDLADTLGRPHHDDVDADVIHRVDAVDPSALDGPVALALHPELPEERDGGLEVVDDDPNVVHALDRHIALEGTSVDLARRETRHPDPMGAALADYRWTATTAEYRTVPLSVACVDATEPLLHRGHHDRPQLRRLVEHVVELAGRDRDHHGVPDPPTGRRPRPAVDRRDLTEEPASADRVDRPTSSLDPDGPRDHDEERAFVPTFVRQLHPGRYIKLLSVLDQRLELASLDGGELREIGEVVNDRHGGIIARAQASSKGSRPAWSSPEWVRARRCHELLRYPLVNVVEPVIEPTTIDLDRFPERKSVELHVGEVLEQDVDGVWGAVRPLELLSGQDGLVGLDERVECAADDDAEVLQAHLVDPLVDGRDELDQRDTLALEDVERLGGDDQGDRATVPYVLSIRDRMTLQQGSHVHVLVPLGHAEREVAERVRGDVDAARQQAVSLLRRERAVVADDVRDRVGHVVPSCRTS